MLLYFPFLKFHGLVFGLIIGLWHDINFRSGNIKAINQMKKSCAVLHLFFYAQKHTIIVRVCLEIGCVHTHTHTQTHIHTWFTQLHLPETHGHTGVKLIERRTSEEERLVQFISVVRMCHSSTKKMCKIIYDKNWKS